MNLSSLFANEWKYVDNTEAVTLFRKIADGKYDGGTSVMNALRMEIKRDGVRVKGRLNWLMWASQAGAPAAKPGDVVQDATGKRWVAETTDIQAYGARYFLEALQEH